MASQYVKLPKEASGGGGTPGGSNTQIQFNDNGSFGGVQGLTWNGTGVAFGPQPVINQGTQPPFAVWTATNQNGLFVGSTSGSTVPGVIFKARDSFGEIQGSTSNLGAAAPLAIQPEGGDLYLGISQLLFPNSDGSPGQVLTTNGSGTLSWVTVSAPAVQTASQEIVLPLDGAVTTKALLSKVGDQVIMQIAYFNILSYTKGNYERIYIPGIIPEEFRPTTGNTGGVWVPVYLNINPGGINTLGLLVVYDNGDVEIYESVNQNGFMLGQQIQNGFAWTISWSTVPFDQ